MKTVAELIADLEARGPASDPDGEVTAALKRLAELEGGAGGKRAARRGAGGYLTVGELAAELRHLNQSLPVGYAYPSGDHWRTTLVRRASEVRVEGAAWSDYHRSLRLQPDDGDETGRDGRVDVVVLE